MNPNEQPKMSLFEATNAEAIQRQQSKPNTGQLERNWGNIGATLVSQSSGEAVDDFRNRFALAQLASWLLCLLIYPSSLLR